MELKSINSEIKNPLTLIAIFAGIAEVACTSVLPLLEMPIQSIFVWFVMIFPVLLVSSFFVTLNFNHKVLYAPSDFKDEKNFMEAMQSGFTPENDEFVILHKFWKSGGTINRQNELLLKQWLNSNGIDSRSITYFLRSDIFSDARKQAMLDLGLKG